jgi:dolichol-phosphate mannosyltransferase
MNPSTAAIESRVSGTEMTPDKSGKLPTAARVTVAILAKNEEATIADVIRSAYSRVDEVIVIDGNSTDRTREIAESLGARAYRDGGKGKGDGIRMAIQMASTEAIVFMDADGSHDAGDIASLTDPILSGEAHLVIGSRWLGGSDELGGDISKFIRSAGSSVITLAINYRWGLHLTDSQNGYRAISADAARAINLTEDIFTIEQEMIMKCLKHGYKIIEVPAHEYKRRQGESQIVVWKVAHRYVWCLLKNLIK